MEWINCSDRLPPFHDIVMVRRKNGEECKCFFHMDQMSWLWFYGIKTSHFQKKDGDRPFLFDVTQWLEVKE